MQALKGRNIIVLSRLAGMLNIIPHLSLHKPHIQNNKSGRPDNPGGRYFYRGLGSITE